MCVCVCVCFFFKSYATPCTGVGESTRGENAENSSPDKGNKGEWGHVPPVGATGGGGDVRRVTPDLNYEREGAGGEKKYRAVTINGIDKYIPGTRYRRYQANKQKGPVVVATHPFSDSTGVLLPSRGSAVYVPDTFAPHSPFFFFLCYTVIAHLPEPAHTYHVYLSIYLPVYL